MEALFAACRPRLTGASIPYTETATRLRADAETIRSGHPRSKRQAIARRLRDAAEAYDEIGKLESSNHHRTAVADIAKFMRERFGSPMHGLTATVASVALECEVSPSKVREWFSRPTRKKAKRAMGKKAKKRTGSP